MTPKDQKKRLERAARKEANKVAATHFHTGEFRLNLALDIRDTLVDFALLAERRGRRDALREAAGMALNHETDSYDEAEYPVKTMFPALHREIADKILALAKRSPRTRG